MVPIKNLENELLDIPAHTTTRLEEWIQEEQVERLLRQLSGRQRQVFTLHYFDGLSYVEIAERLELQKNHVEVIAHRAREILREKTEAVNFFVSFQRVLDTIIVEGFSNVVMHPENEGET